jgi:hypothetical protein
VASLTAFRLAGAQCADFVTRCAGLPVHNHVS